MTWTSQIEQQIHVHDSEQVFFQVRLPMRYPFLPPQLRFVTRIYHPNIDESGRVCMDTLKPAPVGSWRPAMNVRGLLWQLRLLLCSPSPEDPLVPDVAAQLARDRVAFERQAAEWTSRYALTK